MSGHIRIDSPSYISSGSLPHLLAVSDDPTDPLAARAYAESAHAYRSPFVRDCGRILHAKAFRRLAGKTQVFTRRQSENDHSRSRLTHTLEVTQIARTLTGALGLNDRLAEALALVHDIGHPPFGHAGEKALDEALREHDLRFDHNLHALRIVTVFEERYAGFPGLNLTLGVREGIIKHSRDYPADRYPELAEYFLDQQPPLEAQLIDLADEIAYLSADIEDGLGAGILEFESVRAGVPLFARFYSEVESEFIGASISLLTNQAIIRMLNALVTDLISEVARQVHAQGIETLAELRNSPRRIVRLSETMEAERSQAKSFLYEHLYQSPSMEEEHAYDAEVIHTLFSAWTNDPTLLPADHLARVAQEGAPRAVADYIAGMTDSYIEQAWVRFKETQAIGS